MMTTLTELQCRIEVAHPTIHCDQLNNKAGPLFGEAARLECPSAFYYMMSMYQLDPTT